MGDRQLNNPLSGKDWAVLPDIVLIKVYTLLEDYDRAQMARVCWNWHRMFNYPSLWRHRTIKFGSSSTDKTGHKAWKFAKLFAEYVRSLTLGFERPSFRTVKVVSKSAENFLFKLGNLNNLKIQYISIQYLNMEHYWHFITSRNRIVKALARFLKRQRHLLSMNLMAARLTLRDGCRILEALGRGGAGRNLDIIYMEHMFQTNILPFRYRRYINAMRKFTGLRFVHTTYNYTNNELLGIFSEQLGQNFLRMTIMIDTYVTTNKISTDEWKEFVKACPNVGVGVFICSPALRGNIYSVLVRDIPVDAIHVSIWKALTDQDPQLIPNLLEHFANTYHETLGVFQMDLDTNPSIDGFLLNFLKKCKRIRVFLFSGVISLATLEAIYKLQKEGVTELRRLNVVVQGLVPMQFDQLAHTREKMMSLIDRNAVIIEAKMDRSSTGEQTPSPSTESISSFDSDIENPSDDEAYEGL
ncbi:hypothetical protein ScPMuIL_005260 [Solemya velum]